jgi:muramidase (phage lysozyme)
VTDLLAAGVDQNVAAFLRLIREHESSQDDAAYGMRYSPQGGATFDDFTKHPRIFEPTRDGKKSSAAGAYQFTATTWDRIAAKYGIQGFTPPEQDYGAVCLLDDLGVLSLVLAGDIPEAVVACRGTWTSLPGAEESRAAYSMADALAIYAKWGGKLATQPAAPIEERPIPVAPITATEAPMATPAPSPGFGSILQTLGPVVSLFNPIIGAAITAFSPLLQQKIATEVGRHTDPATAAQVAASLSTAIGNAMTQATGQADPLDAVVALRKDPMALAKVEVAVTSKLDELAPFVDRLLQAEKDTWAAAQAGRDAASIRAAADSYDVAPVLVKSSSGMVPAILAGLLMVLGLQVYFAADHKPDPTIVALIASLGTLVFKAWADIFAYRFGGVVDTKVKDAILATAATAKK